MQARLVLALSGLLCCAGACSTVGTLDESRAIDLTHALDERTIAWPTARPFELTVERQGLDEQGRWYASNIVSTSEHAGTHLDAPLHFAREGHGTAAIPLRQLMGPARRIDVRAQCDRSRDYMVQVEDLEEHEQRHGRIPGGAVVLLHTGYGEHYGSRQRYLGSAAVASADDLHFPGLSPAAAELLAARKVDLVGIDTASIDPGTSRDFSAHRILAAAQIPVLENLAHLDRLPERGATVLALPLPIAGGSGSPARVLAFLP